MKYSEIKWRNIHDCWRKSQIIMVGGGKVLICRRLDSIGTDREYYLAKVTEGGYARKNLSAFELLGLLKDMRPCP